MSSRRSRQFQQQSPKRSKIESSQIPPPTSSFSSLSNDFPPLSPNPQLNQHTLSMPTELKMHQCNISLFGSYYNSFLDPAPNLTFHSQHHPYSSPFASIHNHDNLELTPQKFEKSNYPIWNFALIPTDRTNFSSSGSSSCAESQSSNEYDN